MVLLEEEEVLLGVRDVMDMHLVVVVETLSLVGVVEM